MRSRSRCWSGPPTRRASAWSPTPGPGYGRSEPRDRPGTLADDVADAAAVLDAVGVDTFVTLGWSGGGPRAIACAALLTERCLAAASLAGAAPRDAEGLDWMAGMGPENVDEFGAAEPGPSALQGWLEEHGAPVFVVTADEVAASLGELVPSVDRDAMTGEFAEFLASSFRAAGWQGVTGWRDDDLLLVQPWGFDLGAITVPTSVWQGEEDLMVPFDHGRWLAEPPPRSAGAPRDPARATSPWSPASTGWSPSWSSWRAGPASDPRAGRR